MLSYLRTRPIMESAALGIVLLLPVLLLHSRPLTEVGIGVVGLLFVVTSGRSGNWSWLIQDWMAVGLAWWGWTLMSTMLHFTDGDAPRLVQAVLTVRFLVFTAALQHWVLGPVEARRALLTSLALSTLYVGLQVILQFATGHNLYGIPRYGDGSLTGPFAKPRAGPTFVRMVFPPLMSGVGALLARAGLVGRGGALAMVLGAVAVTVLIGQRMPVALLLLGLASAALFMPGLRRVALVAVIAGAAFVAASATISPPTFYRLVTKFSTQIEHFPETHYGQIASRAVLIGRENPLTGLGYAGFLAACKDPRYPNGTFYPDSGTDDDGSIGRCAIHPHNHYLQALDDGGVPGLLLFCALVALWLARLGRGLWRDPDPVRVGLFVAALIQEWPIASTSPIVSLPLGGWLFLLVGFGLAAADAAQIRRT